MKYIIIFTLFAIIIISSNIFSAGSNVKSYPSPPDPIDIKWQWALQQSQKMDEGVWIGWSINRLMSKNAVMGIYITGDDRFDYPTLEQIIYGGNLKNIEDESLSNVAKNALAEMDKKHSDKEEIVEKEIAIMFYYKSFTSSYDKPHDITISNISLYVDLKNKPLIWLGLTPQDESAAFLIEKFSDLNDEEIKEDYITTLGIHQQSKLPLDFLKSIINGDETNDIREHAVFWLGEHNDESSIDFIIKVANNDRSNDVREKAVFALYLMDSEKAENALIEMAKHAKNKSIKKKSIFWLGQKAADKSVGILEEIVEHDDDSNIKEQAVFALSQLDNNEGVPALIEIAKNHKNIEVRKKAIFWLGQSGDDRALDLIISLVQNN